jgi:hypothetical protein
MIPLESGLFRSVEIRRYRARDKIFVLSYRCTLVRLWQLARSGLEVWTAGMKHEPKESDESRFIRVVQFLSPMRVDNIFS